MRSQADSSSFNFEQLFFAIEKTVSEREDESRFGYFPQQTKRLRDETDFIVCELIEAGKTSWKEIKDCAGLSEEQLCESFRRLILEFGMVGCHRSGIERQNRKYYLKADFRLFFSP
ncbi:MAG TPA: hypothetical protein VF596_11840 [Pyrinomonadaceae bacterium]|jgi:hypothetical protein